MSESHVAAKNMTLTSVQGLRIKEESLYTDSGLEFGLDFSRGTARLIVLAPKSSQRLKGFEGEQLGSAVPGSDHTLLVGPLNQANASTLRSELPALRPSPLGLSTSAGFGDRLGLATPGHVRALRAAGNDISPIFAQQSIREMERTRRSPGEVMADATWGAMSEGWYGTFGADADHLKTFEHIDSCIEAGYTFFTFDPGEHVDDSAEHLPANKLAGAAESLPWKELEDSVADLRRRYLGKGFEFEGEELEFDEESLYRAAAKYGRAVNHAASMYRYLEREGRDGEFEVEVSVDETDSPTTHLQHVYIATELQRLGVRWVSLAPRYVGTFEKGVDYIGEPGKFEQNFALHAAIARGLGPYKLSLHSGSDKFSIYEAASRQTRGMVHLKTAGTSYLEALKTISCVDPALFREIYAFARDRFSADRASYHVSASVEATPEDAEDKSLPGLVDEFNAREILHVTFGSVLGDLAEEHDLKRRLLASLGKHEEDYASGLESHFLRHLQPFVSSSRVQ